MGKPFELGTKDHSGRLSFFIPTYSRVEPLRLTVESVIEQWKPDYLDKIIISDNNNSSIAYDVIKEFDTSLLVYSKNETNIGIDRNMLRYLDLCESRYCWLLGDDDILNSLSFDMVQPFLQEDFDFLIILNGTQVTPYKTGIHHLDDHNKTGDFFTYFWDKIPFGNVIVNVEKAKDVSRSIDLNKYIGSSHAYSGILWEILCSEASTKKVVVIEEKAVELGSIQKTWTDDAIKIFLHEIPSWIKLLPEALRNYKVSVFRTYLGTISYRSSLILYAKFLSKGSTNRKIFNTYTKGFPLSFRIKVKIFYLIYPFYRFLVRIIRRTNNS